MAYTSSTCEIGVIKESFYRTGNNGAFQGLFPKFEKNSFKVLEFILTSLKKHFVNFNYNTGMATALDITFKLPTKDGEIDFEYMETLISAVQKLVIKDVVLWADKKISATQQVISNNLTCP